jgi:NADH-quinone oxidoreductase subunit N
MTLDFARQSAYFWALLPEIVLALWTMLVLMVDVFWSSDHPEESRAPVAWMSLAGLVAAGAANLYLLRMTEVAPTGMIAVDSFRIFTNFILLLAAGLAICLSFGYLQKRHIDRGEFYVLVLFATVGMMLMAGSRDLILMFIALEVMSVAIYVLVGYHRQDPRSSEASLKYFLLGAFSSGFFLYGIALIFGATGSTHLPTIGTVLADGGGTGSSVAQAGMALLLVGLAFKVAAVPFHVWTPDAYDGAPTPVTALMATGVKAAAFAAFIRVFAVGFGGVREDWAAVIWVLAALTMLVANLIALTQGSVKRMLAYSSVAHAGYLLVALLSSNQSGAAAFLFYLLVYTLMTAGAFGIVIANSRGDWERVSLQDYAGFGWQQPLLGAAFGLFLLSLAGFPLTGGFLGKLYIIRSALEANNVALAVVLVLASLISYFYYLRVIVVMYMRPAASEDAHAQAGLPMPGRAVIALAAVAVLALFFVASPVMRAAESSVASLFPAAPALFGMTP